MGSSWLRELTAVIVVTDRAVDLAVDGLEEVRRFELLTRKGQCRHLVLTATELAVAGERLLSQSIGPSLIGRYERRAQQLPEQAEPASSPGLLLGLTDCRSTEDYDGFNQWYDTVHAADVLKSGFYWRAHRYERVAGEAPDFLACYESSQSGAEALKALMAHYEHNPSPVDPICVVRHVWPFERGGAQ